MALIIAGERSGVGKTTVTLALLSFLARQKNKVQSFKVGPDYIDPMFHTLVTGRPCRNLDPVLTSQAYVQSCFSQHCQDVDYALVEGVMGLFDGVAGSRGAGEQGSRGDKGNNLPISHSQLAIPNYPFPINDFASTAHIARLLNLPILLVINCSRLSGSVAAIAQGYRTFDARLNLAGVVLNRVGSERHLQLLKEALEPLNLPILGVLRRQSQITIPDRHLGLVPTAELEYGYGTAMPLPAIFDQLAHLGAACFDWKKLFPFLQVSNFNLQPLTADPAGTEFRADRDGRSSVSQAARKQESGGAFRTFNLQPPTNLQPLSPSAIRIAIARDRAFNFYYRDNLDILEQLGAELIPWSPLEDSALPPRTQGLYFGGGFPEVFAQALAQNRAAFESVRAAIQSGMPTYAECGGLMYLCETLVDFAGKAWPMVGLLPTTAVMSQQLTLGYRQAKALQDSPLLRSGETVWAHEFHRSVLTSPPQQPLFQLNGLSSTPALTEGWQLLQLHASYLHLHFGQSQAIPKRFLQNCLAFLA